MKVDVPSLVKSAICVRQCYTARGERTNMDVESPSGGTMGCSGEAEVREPEFGDGTGRVLSLREELAGFCVVRFFLSMVARCECGFMFKATIHEKCTDRLGTDSRCA